MDSQLENTLVAGYENCVSEMLFSGVTRSCALSSNFSVYIKFFDRILIETNVNKSNELIFF